jgi:hypothetical protein
MIALRAVVRERRRDAPVLETGVSDLPLVDLLAAAQKISW